jgi:hypothetical protein
MNGGHMNLNKSILINLSAKIAAGYPITAIATANVYLKKDCPIRLALASLAKSSIKASRNPDLIRLLNGEILTPAKLEQQISQFDQSIKVKKTTVIPTLFSKKHLSENNRRSSPRDINRYKFKTISLPIRASVATQEHAHTFL